MSFGYSYSDAKTLKDALREFEYWKKDFDSKSFNEAQSIIKESGLVNKAQELYVDLTFNNGVLKEALEMCVLGVDIELLKKLWVDPSKR